MAVLTRRELDDGVKETLKFLSKVEFFPFFRSWFERPKEEFNPYSEHFKTIEFQVDEKTFRFSFRQ